MATSLFANEVQRLVTDEGYTYEEAQQVAGGYIRFLYPQAQQTVHEIAEQQHKIEENLQSEHTSGKIRKHPYQTYIDFFTTRKIDIRQIAKAIPTSQKELLRVLKLLAQEVRAAHASGTFVSKKKEGVSENKKYRKVRTGTVPTLSSKYMHQLTHGSRKKHYLMIRNAFFAVGDSYEDFLSLKHDNI